MPRSPRATPLLASDVRRSMLAGLAAAVIAAPLSAVLQGAVGVTTEAVRTSLYASWCLLVITMAGFAMIAFGRATEAELRAWLLDTRAPRNRLLHILWASAGGGAIWWAISGTAITMYTLVGLALQPSAPSPTLMAFGVAVVVCSYAMIIMSYAVHYARIDAETGGFSFPGEHEVRFIEYVYVAAQVSTTFGSSDVSLTTSRARRAVTFQSLLAMAFNTVLVSLFVSVLLRAAQPSG